MSIKCIDRNSGKGKDCIAVFLCDSAEDVANLPNETNKGSLGEECSAGSIAIIAEDHGTIILNNQGVWV